MRIETKFDLKDKVYFVKANKIRKGKIIRIVTESFLVANRPETQIKKYHVLEGATDSVLPEEELFATIDELTASLVGEYKKGAKR